MDRRANNVAARDSMEGFYMGLLRRMVAVCALVVLFGSLPELLMGGETVLLDFETDWCGVCRVMDPVVQQLAAEGYSIRKVNAEREPELAARFNVDRYPTFVVVRNGQEVGRRLGQVSKAELVAMLGKADARTVRGQSPDRSGASPSDPFQRPALPAGKNDNDAWQSGAKAVSAAATNVAGRTQGTSPLVLASVRVRIQEATGQSTGSGTIIDAREGEALVLTCGHVFRDFKSEAQKIQVDLFGAGAPQSVPAKLLSYDLNSDVGLVRMQLSHPVVAAKVAPPGLKCRVGEKVISVGCDGGAEASERATEVVSVDRYTHAPNLQVAFTPVQGRSGGGLFNSQGYVVGVCNAADKAENQGLFASAAAIHSELDRANLQFVYRDGAASAGQLAGGALTQPARGDLRPLDGPVRNVSLSADEQSVLERLRRSPQQAEMFVFMPGGQPGAPAGQLVQMSKFSPEFWRLLAESRRQGSVELTSIPPTVKKPAVASADGRQVWPR
jgi:thiol-disulfide isomerase/thioredoxin